MKTLVIAVLVVVFASVAQGAVLDVYGTGDVKATLCGGYDLGNGMSTNGFVDIKEDGWFSKVRLVYQQDAGLAAELRTSSTGYHSLAVGPQIQLHDKYGFVRVNYWLETETGKPVVSVWQQHTIAKNVWTNGWCDFKSTGTNAELQVGYKVNQKTDIVCEYRFGSLRTSKELGVGLQFAL